MVENAQNVEDGKYGFEDLALKKKNKCTKEHSDSSSALKEMVYNTDIARTVGMLASLGFDGHDKFISN
jgi:hypothetical protein